MLWRSSSIFSRLDLYAMSFPNGGKSDDSILVFGYIFNMVLYALLTTSLVTRFIALSHPLEDEDGQREKF